MTKAEHTCHTCIEVVCEMYGYKKADMLKMDRHEPLAYHRHLAMALSYELSGLATQRIAHIFNRGDHGTVLNSISRVREECRRNGERKETYLNLRQMVVDKLKHAVQPK